jgi:hypothetical protein
VFQRFTFIRRLRRITPIFLLLRENPPETPCNRSKRHKFLSAWAAARAVGLLAMTPHKYFSDRYLERVE